MALVYNGLAGWGRAGCAEAWCGEFESALTELLGIDVDDAVCACSAEPESLAGRKVESQRLVALHLNLDVNTAVERPVEILFVDDFCFGQLSQLLGHLIKCHFEVATVRFVPRHSAHSPTPTSTSLRTARRPGDLAQNSDPSICG